MLVSWFLKIHRQHDNASTHFGSDFAPFVAATTDEEWDIWMTKKPANSPDLKINDLSFFGVLQSGKWNSLEQEANHDVDVLIEAVQAAFISFEPIKLNSFFLTLQGCLKGNILNNGDKNHGIPPHIGMYALVELGGWDST